MSDSGRKKPPLVAERRYSKTSKAKSKASSPKKAAAPKKAKPKRRSPNRKASAKPVGNPITRFFKRLIGLILRIVWGFSWRIGATFALILALAVGYVFTTLPAAETLLDGRAKGSVTMTDRDGKVFAWRGDQFGGVVTADAVSPHLKNAVVATEDKRFYRHFGISPRGVASAVRINLREGRGPLSGHGGSTITQQTAKLLCLGVEYNSDDWESEAAYESDCRQGSLWRKVKEAVYALAMESKYSKDEILSIYLNRAYMGGGAYGAEAAAQRFFGKPASALDPAEGAMLAGLLTAPTSLAPTNNLQRSQNRAGVVIALMRDQDYLSDTAAQNALDHPAQLSPAAEARAGGYFADWVMSSGPEFFTRNSTSDVVIRTTLDQRIQKAAEAAMNYIYSEKIKQGSEAQAAIVVMSADGAVRAMVGGRETRVSGVFNRATTAKRQSGSAFKPFVYATALELGWSSNDTVMDEPLTINIPGSGPWSPKNYDKKYHGEVTLTEALRSSLNIPAVKMARSAGLDNVRRVAEGFGIRSDLAQGPALALGASETTLIEMTGAYAGILNGGSSVTPYGLVELRMQGDDDPLMTATGGIRERVISENAARELTWMMYNVATRGSGRRANLPDREVAGKTGTSSDAKDAWFIGFTADYVAGVWMGYDNNTPLSGVTGSGLPAEIWHETMARVHEGIDPKPLPMLRDGSPPKKTRSNNDGSNDTRGGIDKLLRDLLGAGDR
ncbi:Penicillin-binding protein 2D [Thalassovita gelatinovora]|uniref:peptidoglycan glycosyltransferase n=1 Tax=Thalassovita gelatinovora TaxID=53501 RepID=A0A0P1F5P9_THAGE|nr:PBP1A family penicillin-binding protein [Thalassovita gelatinovora]QIZ80799.1 PBP1A family penicillin-binding protein [Thalassovita gelatinovora]CUH63190.1 Penicillin-binding protein 2D [Thalassovita gelatinovora]SEQ63176.1 penicillin-binding protein, 1A family [Thalassovita gelatinovora]